MSQGAPSETVFADRGALSADHRPDRFEYRDAELRALGTALSPAVASGGSARVLVCGPPAQGKRTAVAVATERLAAGSASADPDLVPVPCSSGATAYGIAIAATNALRGDDELSESGYAGETVFRRLRRGVRETDGTPVLRLDHVQRVEPSEFEVLLAGLFDEPDAPPCALVAVADELEYRNALALETRRRLDRECYFAPYAAGERRSIVEDRVESAFRGDACPDDVLEQCLSGAETATAPIRWAFDVLRLAGDEANRSGRQTVTRRHLEAARSDVERDRLLEALESRSSEERRTLAAVATVDDGRFESIYDAYRRRCESGGVSPNRRRSVHNYLDALVEADLVEAAERRASSGGRYFEYRLAPDEDALGEALGDPGQVDGDRAGE